MAKRTDINSILIIGAGPIVIGQACEFDYSGAQACKALREEGYRVILVNSNPATIMTDPETADAVYIEPIHWRFVEQIIATERPDALLPTMGGQTALNCALDLAREGVLEKYGVEMIGASREAIDTAEDREKFRDAMTEIGLESPRADIAHSLEEALQKQAAIGYPMVLKVPDGSFSRGVIKVNDLDELKRGVRQLFRDTELVLAQSFVPTQFDWRVGLVAGEALYVCQYGMAPGHWQIINHAARHKRASTGDHVTLAVEDAPVDVISLAARFVEEPDAHAEIVPPLEPLAEGSP